MPPAPIPDNERKRLEAIASNPWVQARQDSWTDHLVRSAAALAGCPIALVSVVDDQRQWFRARVGLGAEETPREQAFCAFTILGDDPLIVEDATQDPRFSDNPLVTSDPRIRFYAGIPIRDVNGLTLGSFCVIDTVPRRLSAEQIQGLESLAQMLAMHNSAARRHEAILDASLDTIVTIDAESQVREFNRSACEMFGYTSEEAIGASLTELIVPPSFRDAHKAGMRRYLETGDGPVLGKRIEITAMRKGGELFPVELAISPIQVERQPYFTAFIRDLSETHELNRDLRLTRFTVDKSRDSVFWVGADARFTYVNEAASQSLGYSQEELLGMRVFDIEGMLGPDTWNEHWGELREHGSLLLQSYHRKKDGTEFPVELVCNFIEHEGQEINCVVARDVTDRKQAEASLRHSEQRFRDIAEASGEFIWETDELGIITYLSEAVSLALGYQREQLTGQRFRDQIDAEDADRFDAHLVRSATSGKPMRNVEFRFIHADGTPRWVRLSGRPLHSESTQLLGFRGMGFDVTEFKRLGEMQRRLGELQNLARSIVSDYLQPNQLDDASHQFLNSIGTFYGARGAVLTRIGGGGDGPLAVWSDESTPDAAPELPVGWSTLVRDQLDGGNVVAHAEEGLWDLFIPVIIDGTLGRVIHFQECGYPVLPPASEREILQSMASGMGHSIERSLRRLELSESADKLAGALKLANEANEAKTAFLANMSHELRTPLTAVLGFAEILQTGNHTRDDQAVILHKIDQNGLALLKIINSILDLSKIESGSITPRSHRVDLRDLIASSSSSTAEAANKKGLTLVIDVGDGVPESFSGDGTRIRQILTNLLSNAVKFTERGTVSVRFMTHGVAEDLKLHFIVADTGCGIPRSFQERVFQPFDRAGASSDVGGTGLGLSIVYRLVQLLGGTVGFTSEPGEGSEFRVLLPIEVPSENCLRPGPFDVDQLVRRAGLRNTQSTRIDGLRVLLAEDSDEIREVVEYFLVHRGASVLLCRDGGAAVDMARSLIDEIDVVLMDMQMPVRDGYEATRMLRSDGFDKPIVALTAHGMRHDRDRCLAAGCTDYISKPVDPELLASVLAAYIPKPSPPVPRRFERRHEDHPADRDTYLAGLMSRFRVHLAGELAFFMGESSLEDLEATRRRVHKIAGSAGNLGFPEITEKAKECEQGFTLDLTREGARTCLNRLTDTIQASLVRTSDQSP